MGCSTMLLSLFCQIPTNPSRIRLTVEQSKSKSTQPRFARRWTTLYVPAAQSKCSREALDSSTRKVFLPRPSKQTMTQSRPRAKKYRPVSQPEMMLYLGRARHISQTLCHKQIEKRGTDGGGSKHIYTWRNYYLFHKELITDLTPLSVGVPFLVSSFHKNMAAKALHLPRR